jgi:O-antigen ligase
MQSGYIEAPGLNRWSPPVGIKGLPSLEAIIFTGAGLALLFIGSWVPSDRLNINDVPVDMIAVAAATLLATLSSIRPDVLRMLATLQIPLLLLGITIVWSPLPEVGFDNLTSLVFTSFIVFLLFNTVIERYGENELARVLVIFLALDLLIAVVYKALFGFFDRQVMFFLNGPIVFGRVMSVGLILSLYVFRGYFRIVAAAAFFAAIVWTESKGPILAATLTLLAMGWLSSGRRGRFVVLLACFAVVMTVVVIAQYYEISAKQVGRLAILLNVLSGDTTLPMLVASDTGRANLWGASVDMIFAYPFGVGLGGWAYYAETTLTNPYPHNLFLELWSEGGIVLGTLACIPLLLFFAVRRNIFWFVALCLFLAQLVSGNIGDARQMYVFALLAIFRPAPAPSATAR